MSARRSRVVGGIAALPAIALAVASLWWSAGAIRGNGLWPPDDVTLSEAIATRNNAEALRLIALGANPNVPSRVRDGMLTYGYDVTMRPLEAAVGAQREDSLRLLLEHGAIVDAALARTLRCYERVHPERGIRTILEGLSSEPIECDGVPLPTDRSRRP
jgi:hypothetical protein